MRSADNFFNAAARNFRAAAFIFKNKVSVPIFFVGSDF